MTIDNLACIKIEVVAIWRDLKDANLQKTFYLSRPSALLFNRGIVFFYVKKRS